MAEDFRRVGDDLATEMFGEPPHNSQIIPTALIDEMAVLSDRRVQRLGGAAVREAMKVSDAASVRLHADEWFHPELYRPTTPAETEQLLVAYDRLAEHLSGHKLKSAPGGYTYVKKASGIHWDIVYRRRKSEADHLTVVCVADRYGVEVPLNRRVGHMINEIEAGTREMGWHNIDEANAYAEHLGVALP